MAEGGPSFIGGPRARSGGLVGGSKPEARNLNLVYLYVMAKDRADCGLADSGLFATENLDSLGNYQDRNIS